MGLIDCLICFCKGHHFPGSPSINKDGCFTITCIKCGKSESLKPPKEWINRYDKRKLS